MKMCRMSLGVKKLYHIKSQHIRGTLHIKEAIVEEVKNERNDWFAKVHSQDESNIARKTLSIDIPQALKRGRPKHSWAGQMRQWNIHKRRSHFLRLFKPPPPPMSTLFQYL